jgi:hypothetical protein
MKSEFNLNELRQFTGSEQLFRHGINRNLVYTEGVQYLAEKAECYWLIDEIATIVFPYLLKRHYDEFYLIKFLVTEYNAVITVEDGNNKLYANHRVKFTDFPISGIPIKFYLCASDGYYCLMLPSEY